MHTHILGWMANLLHLFLYVGAKGSKHQMNKVNLLSNRRRKRRMKLNSLIPIKVLEI